MKWKLGRRRRQEEPSLDGNLALMEGKGADEREKTSNDSLMMGEANFSGTGLISNDGRISGKWRGRRRQKRD